MLNVSWSYVLYVKCEYINKCMCTVTALCIRFLLIAERDWLKWPTYPHTFVHERHVPVRLIRSRTRSLSLVQTQNSTSVSDGRVRSVTTVCEWKEPVVERYGELGSCSLAYLQQRKKFTLYHCKENPLGVLDLVLWYWHFEQFSQDLSRYSFSTLYSKL